MDRETLYERLAKLMQKSRKALRLYSTVGRIQGERASEFSEAQVREWREVNSELLRQLSLVMDRPQSRTLVSEVVAIRDFFYNSWREAEADLHRRQRELISVSENGDFVKAALLAEELVSLKARMQAAHAAHHEFNEVIRKSRVSTDVRETIELSRDQILPEDVSSEIDQPAREDDSRLAKVIPLRRAQ